MAKINILKKNGKTIYPGTIPQAVVDPTTGKNITEVFASKNVATSSKLGLIKGGTDIVVGGDGTVTVNNKIIPKMYKMGVGSKYKLFSITDGVDKGSIVFSILSPVLNRGGGYAKYIIFRPYESTTVKNWYPKCIYATDSSMYNRIKLVRTGNKTFDVYYQSNEDNDYCTFILDETTSTNVDIIASGTSSIPEDIYKESEYTPVYLGNIYTGTSIVLEKTSSTKTPYIYTDNNYGRGIVLRWSDSEGDLKELGMWNDGTPYWASNYNTRYTLYHTGNLVNATTSKNGLMSADDKTKLDGLSDILKTETNIGAEVFKTPGVYVAPISSIYINGTDTPLYGNSTIITIGNNAQAGYIEQVIITSIDDKAKMFYRSWDLTTEPFDFVPLLPDVATQYTAGLVKSGGDITVSDNGEVTVNNSSSSKHANAISFNNSSDAINIDNYPQDDYGTIIIWYNDAQADRSFSPGQEGVIYQTKYKSQGGETDAPYHDCLTQLYVGSGGIKHRTAIDYDIANPFDGIAWS